MIEHPSDDVAKGFLVPETDGYARRIGGKAKHVETSVLIDVRSHFAQRTPLL